MLCTPTRHHWLVRINQDKMRSGGNSPRPACVRVYTIRMVGVSSDSLGGSEIMTQPCSHYAISVCPSQEKWQLLQEKAIIPFIMSGSRQSNSHTVKVDKKLRCWFSKGVGGPPQQTFQLGDVGIWWTVSIILKKEETIRWFQVSKVKVIFDNNNNVLFTMTIHYAKAQRPDTVGAWPSTWNNQCWGSHGNWLQWCYIAMVFWLGEPRGVSAVGSAD